MDMINVIIDGKDMTVLPRRELLEMRRSISMIFQGFNLLEQRSVLRNVCFPLEMSGTKSGEAKKRALELLKLVGLESKANAYPAQLSGGQKQRVAIARALATNPRYLLCDAATSALEPTTTRSILELLREINQSLGVTIIVITHEMKVIDQICDRVAVIDQSCIAEEGKVSDVFTNPQSEIARELIIPQLVLECQAPVNIIFADTREFDGAIYGHMIIELPSDERQADKILVWLKNSPVTWKEEE